MYEKHFDRRTVLRTLGAGVAGVLATGQARAAPSFDSELETVRQATEKYRTVGAVLGAVEWAIPVGARGYDEGNQPDLFGDVPGEGEEHWHVHHSRRHVFATPDGGVTDPQELSVGQLLQRGRWAETPPDVPVEPGDDATADWGLTGTNETRTVDLAPDPHPDLLTLHAWVHLLNRHHPLAPFNPNQEYVHMLPDAIMSDRTAKPG